MKTVTFDITGMNCEGCSQTICNALTRQPGVQVCNVSFEDGQAHVVFDENQTSPEALQEVIERAGYTATANP